jgi:hypothetical protein
MSDINSKLDRIKLISLADEGSIKFLLNCLDDLGLLVRAAAYERIKSLNIEDNGVAKAIDQGILLRPEDIVYSVYKSGLLYTDDHYIICDYTDYSGKEIYGTTITDSSFNSHYETWNRGVPNQFVATHATKESAELCAREVMKSLVINNEPHPFGSFCSLDSEYKTNKNLRISQQDIYNWASRYQIMNVPQPKNPEAFNWDRFDNRKNKKLDYDSELFQYTDQLHYYACRILEYLDFEAHYDVIEKIYIYVVGRLAYVSMETVVKECYWIP